MRRAFGQQVIQHLHIKRESLFFLKKLHCVQLARISAISASVWRKDTERFMSYCAQPPPS